MIWNKKDNFADRKNNYISINNIVMKKVMMMLTAVLLTACTKTDLFDEGQLEKDTKKAYAENFTKAYPNVDLNQSWDYSHKNPAYSLSTSNHALTRAESFTLTQGSEYEVDASTLNWLKGKLKNGKNNRNLGKAFYMKAPANNFTIVPIFQGQASSIWELHAVINGVDIKVWEKCQDIWMKTSGSDEWKSVSSVSTNELNKNTENATAVKAKTYTFNNVPAGADMYFYLTVTKVTNSKYDYTINSQMSSLSGMMLSLSGCERPANIEEGNEITLIACEDVYDHDNVKSDNDMNDVVFMVYGKPEVPTTTEIEDGQPIVKQTTVRYMIEDLGATDDFDFNDIVVDVTETALSTPHYNDDYTISWTDSEPTQKAIIRHLGGTLPFKLTIGNTELEEMQGVLGSNPNEEYDVTGWNKNTHNISVKVKQASNSTVYNNVAFPKSGEAPMIVAKDPQVEWMPERQHVPEDWFYIPTEE